MHSMDAVHSRRCSGHDGGRHRCRRCAITVSVRLTAGREVFATLTQVSRPMFTQAGTVRERCRQIYTGSPQID